MSQSKTTVTSNAKKIENEKTKTQASELEALKKQKQEADNLAKQKQKESLNNAKQNKEEKDNSAALASLAVGAIGAIRKTSKKKGSLKSLFIGIIIGAVIGFLFATFLGSNSYEPTNNEELSETIFTHTEVDFEDAILGEVKQHQELIVMEQPLEINTTITKTGLGNLDIFSKVKNVKYVGKGLYTVDMSKIDSDHIDVDTEAKIVKIIIPHTVLQEVILDVDNTQFEDTEKGLLAFGDLSLTLEDQNKIEKSAKQAMNQTLNKKELFDQADEFAKLKTWQIFQPLVTSVSGEYIVEMVFE